jgi:hypothetical protein
MMPRFERFDLRPKSQSFDGSPGDSEMELQGNEMGKTGYDDGRISSKKVIIHTLCRLVVVVKTTSA